MTNSETSRWAVDHIITMAWYELRDRWRPVVYFACLGSKLFWIMRLVPVEEACDFEMIISNLVLGICARVSFAPALSSSDLASFKCVGCHATGGLRCKGFWNWIHQGHKSSKFSSISDFGLCTMVPHWRHRFPNLCWHVAFLHLKVVHAANLILLVSKTILSWRLRNIARDNPTHWRTKPVKTCFNTCRAASKTLM